MNQAIATTKLDIVTVEQAIDYLTALNEAGLRYHLEDDPADCLSHHGLTDDQLEAIRHNSDQALAVDWESEGYTCAFDYILTHLN